MQGTEETLKQLKNSLGERRNSWHQLSKKRVLCLFYCTSFFSALDSISLFSFFLSLTLFTLTFHLFVLHSLYATSNPRFPSCGFFSWEDSGWEIPSPDSSWIVHRQVPTLDQARNSLDVGGFAAKPSPAQTAIGLCFHCLSLQDSTGDWKKKRVNETFLISKMSEEHYRRDK